MTRPGSGSCEQCGGAVVKVHHLGRRGDPQAYKSIHHDVLAILHGVAPRQVAQPGAVALGIDPGVLQGAYSAVSDLAHGDDTYPRRPVRVLHRHVCQDPNHLRANLVRLKVACSSHVSHILVYGDFLRRGFSGFESRLVNMPEHVDFSVEGSRAAGILSTLSRIASRTIGCYWERASKDIGKGHIWELHTTQVLPDIIGVVAIL